MRAEWFGPSAVTAIPVAILLAAAAGCNNSGPTSGAPPVNVTPGRAVTTAGGSGSGSGGAAAEAQAAAAAFLKPLLAGDVAGASALVAPELKKQLTKPVYEDEQKVGYSEGDMQKLLKTWTAGHKEFVIRSQVVAPTGTAASVRGDLTGGAAKAAFAMWVWKTDAGWRVMRFAVTKPVAESVPPAGSDVELAWQREAALDFLDGLLGGPEDHEITMLTMSDEFKQKRVPSPSIADPGLGYAKKDVRKWLAEQRAGFTAYTILGQTPGPNRLEVKGELRGAGPTKKFTLVVIATQDGRRVDSLTVE